LYRVEFYRYLGALWWRTWIYMVENACAIDNSTIMETRTSRNHLHACTCHMASPHGDTIQFQIS
jgi:hypothetical protein